MTAAPSWIEHSDVVMYLVGFLFVIISGLVARTLKKVDANQTKLFERLDRLTQDFYKLQGEHEAIKSVHNQHFGGRFE